MRLRLVKFIFSLATLVLLSACGTFEKSCTDGVCKIVENGEVRYEGDAEKVAHILAAEKRGYENYLQFKDLLSKVPRKADGEKVRIAVIFNQVAPELKKHVAAYRRGVRKRMKRDRRVVYVSEAKIKKALAANRGKVASVKKTKLQDWVSEVALFNAGADVVALIDLKVKPTELKDKTKADFPSFEVSLSSAYAMQTFDKSFLGRSVSAAEEGVRFVNGPPRNIRRDGIAIAKLSRFITRQSVSLRRTMPSEEALAKVYAQRLRQPASVERPKVKAAVKAAPKKKARPKVVPVESGDPVEPEAAAKAKPVIEKKMQPAVIPKAPEAPASDPNAPETPLTKALEALKSK